MEQRIKDKIRLYGEIYIECLAISIKANPNNSRYMANEMFREVAKDMRSELISRLQNGLQNLDTEGLDNKALGTERDADLRHLHDELVKDKPEMIILENKQDIDVPEGKPPEPATINQKHALHKFGIKRIPEYLGIKEAGEILNILVCRSREGDHEVIADLVEQFNKEWAENPTTIP